MLPDFTYCGAAAGNRQMAIPWQSRRALPCRAAALPISRYRCLALLLVATIAKEISQETLHVKVIAFF